jgi:sugar O-acyltransferase (sialic acid O-acetyltransferase NeuD family)
VIEEVVVIGSGAHAQVADNIFRHQGLHVVGLYGKERQEELSEILERQDSLANSTVGVHLAIGNNELRRKISGNIASENLQIVSAISKHAIIEGDSHLGFGVFIAPLVYLGIKSRIGSHTIVNTGAILDHDVNVSSFCHIAGNAYIAGGVSIGEGTFIGAGATVIDGVQIGAEIIVGAGAVVVKSILEKGTYVGVPAKQVK